MVKFPIVSFVALCVVLSSAVAYPYILPDYHISEEENQITAEEALYSYKGALSVLGQQVNTRKLRAHRRDRKVKLDQKERRFAALHGRYCDAIGFWQQTVDLKTSLLELVSEAQRKDATFEADTIARSIISSLYRVSNEWRVGGSSLFRNFLIRVGVKQKGFCYHYVGEMLKDLPKREWLYYDFHWGAAWEGGFRENNALVITAKDQDFENGIAVDAWRATGRPFWVPIKGDRFPWKEQGNIADSLLGTQQVEKHR